MSSKLKSVPAGHALKDDAELLESFESILLELQRRALAHCGTRTERSDGEVEFQVLLYGDE